MNATDETFGKELSILRTERGLSLEKMSRDIKVRKSVIEALEEGDMAKLPHRIFVKGYIKAYADRLGLDAKPILEKFEALHEKQKNDVVLNDGDAIKSRNPLRWIIGAILIIGVGVLIVWWIGWGRRTERSLPAPAPTERASSTALFQATEVTPSESSAAKVPAEETGHKTEVKSSEKIAVSGLSSGLEEAKASKPSDVHEPTGDSGSPPPPSRGLVVQCGAECWIKVSSAGKVRAARLMKPGDVLKLSGASFKVTIGNTPGVKLFYKGKVVKLPSRSGKVLKDFRIPPEKGSNTDG